MTNNMRPIHPGEVLKEEIDELGFSASRVANMLQVPVNRVTSILNCKRAITADTALRLAIFFGTSPEFWLNLQSTYDLKITIAKFGKKIKREVTPGKAA